MPTTPNNSAICAVEVQLLLQALHVFRLRGRCSIPRFDDRHEIAAVRGCARRSRASDKVNTACKTLASASATPFSTADVTALVNEGVPALVKVIDASNWTKDQKSAAEIALRAAQLTVSTALADYVSAPPAAAPVAASGTVAS
ncbi:hypothetical protein FVF58_27365 [Paraburkholderia panacisoli]|uniref:Uncharacterized protein n=1 Tax=Paraburkholderia panacisoli TaxID=2603818 RepID=A0A5B0GTS5_9BURK|nr:hypothetical protein [Paraburkholderia panacisoli]KAA1006294.1 hypothetical protein FVF58_27365 [Paraburkholderia panacisoli]